MEKVVKEIQTILSALDKKTQMNVIKECASTIGTPEWQEAVKELIRRMDELDKKQI
jgi:hypothetical protein